MFCKVFISSCLKAVIGNIDFSTDAQIVLDLVVLRRMMYPPYVIKCLF